MAIFRLEVKIHSRAEGASAVAAAAYRSGERLRDTFGVPPTAAALAAYRSGEALEAPGSVVHDYRRKNDVAHAEIMAPAGAPGWVYDRQELWLKVEAAERRRDAQLAREVLVSLPPELSREQQVELLRGFIREHFTRAGMIADAAIHDRKARDEQGRNIHAHILLTTRRLDAASASGFGKKARDWNRRELVQEWRASWCEHVNRALERANRPERVDHRRLTTQLAAALERGDFAAASTLDRLPQPKLGARAAELERRGVRTDRGDELRRVQAANAVRRETYAAAAELPPSHQRTFLRLRLRLGERLADAKVWPLLRRFVDRAMARVRAVLARAAAKVAAELRMERAAKAAAPELRQERTTRPDQAELSPAMREACRREAERLKARRRDQDYGIDL